MNKKYILLSCLLIAVLLGTSVLATVYKTPLATGGRLKFTLLNQDPDPVSPGDYIELRWTIENYGAGPTPDVYVEILPEYPFSLRPGDPAIESIGSLTGRQMGEEAITFYKKLQVHENAVEGTDGIKLRFKEGKDGEWITFEEFDVRIQSVDAALSIESVKTTPTRFIPGNPGALDVKIKNLADSVMRDISFKLDLTLSTIVSGSTTADLVTAYQAIPFVPSDSSSEKHIKLLKAGESKIISYTLATYPDAEAGTYKIPVTLSYRDEINTEFTKNDIIGLTIGATPDIYVVIDSSDLVAGKKSGQVSFKIVNKGVSDVKFVDVVLEETDDYSIISNSEEYIGNIDSDDFESVDFQIYLKNNNDAKSRSALEFPLKLMLKDANNIDYEEAFKLQYKIYTAEEKGQAQSRGMSIIFLVIVMMIVIWVVYRRWEKRRKAKQKK